MNAIPPGGLRPGRGRRNDGAAAGPAARGAPSAPDPEGIAVEELEAHGDPIDPSIGSDPEGLPDPAVFAGFIRETGRTGAPEAAPEASGPAEPAPAGDAGRAGARRPARTLADSLPPHLAGLEIILSVEVGRARVPLADLVAVEPGQLFDLDTLVSEPVSILANGRPFASGEIVAVGDRFGVRIVALAEPGP